MPPLLRAPLAASHAAASAKPGSKRLLSSTGDATRSGTSRGTPFGYSLCEVGTQH
jgi:hypothetical protein